MRLVTYREKDGSAVLGVATSAGVLSARECAKGAGLSGDFGSLRRVLEENLLELLKDAADRAVRDGKTGPPLESLTLLAPIPEPPKILGIALNYKDGFKGDAKPPEVPRVFGKFVSAVNHPGGSVDILGHNATYEGELGAVIGKTAKDVKCGDAWEYVAGYTAVNDITANSCIKEDVQMFRGKNLDGSLPMGPVFVTSDEIGDPMRLTIRTTVNKEVRQDSCTDQMILDIPGQIAYFSSFLTLEPGTVIATGTPFGTALQMDPPGFLRPGDVVEVTIDKIGTLKSVVK